METKHFIALLASITTSFICISVIVWTGKQWSAQQATARARRMAEHRMNARLLRLNI